MTRPQIDLPAVFVDPGVEKGHAACGVSRSGEITTVDMCDAWVPWMHPYHTIIVETPEAAFGGTVETIIRLARAAERAVREWPLERVRYVSPSGSDAWKAGPKSEHQLHMWDALTAAERWILVSFARMRNLKGFLTEEEVGATLRARAVKKAKGEFIFGNVLDACGLALYCTGRIDKYGRIRA